MRIATLVFAAAILVTPSTLFPKPAQHDAPAEMETARSALKTAYNDLERAGTDWGGHKSKAMQHIQEAMSELNESEKWAREHHDMK